MNTSQIGALIANANVQFRQNSVQESDSQLKLEQYQEIFAENIKLLSERAHMRVLQLDTLISSFFDETTNRIDLMDNLIVKCTNDYASLCGSFEELANERVNMIETINNLDAENASFRNQMNNEIGTQNTTTSPFPQPNMSNDNTIEQYQQTIEQLHDTVKNLQSQLKQPGTQPNFSGDFAILSKKLVEKETEISVLQHKLHENDESRRILVNQNLELNDKIEALQTDTVHVQSDPGVINTQWELQKQQIETQYANQLNVQMNEISHLRSELTQLEKAKNSAQFNLEVSQQTESDLRSQINARDTEIESLKSLVAISDSETTRIDNDFQQMLRESRDEAAMHAKYSNTVMGLCGASTLEESVETLKAIIQGHLPDGIVRNVDDAQTIALLNQQIEQMTHAIDDKRSLETSHGVFMQFLTQLSSSLVGISLSPLQRSAQASIVAFHGSIRTHNDDQLSASSARCGDVIGQILRNARLDSAMIQARASKFMNVVTQGFSEILSQTNSIQAGIVKHTVMSTPRPNRDTTPKKSPLELRPPFKRF